MRKDEWSCVLVGGIEKDDSVRDNSFAAFTSVIRKLHKPGRARQKLLFKGQGIPNAAVLLLINVNSARAILR